MPFDSNASRTKILRLRLRMTASGGQSRNAVFILIARQGDTITLGPVGPIKPKNLKNLRGGAPSTFPFEPSEPFEPFEPSRPKGVSIKDIIIFLNRLSLCHKVS